MSSKATTARSSPLTVWCNFTKFPARLPIDGGNPGVKPERWGMGGSQSEPRLFPSKSARNWIRWSRLEETCGSRRRRWRLCHALPPSYGNFNSLTGYFQYCMVPMCHASEGVEQLKGGWKKPHLESNFLRYFGLCLIMVDVPSYILTFIFVTYWNFNHIPLSGRWKNSNMTCVYCLTKMQSTNLRWDEIIIISHAVPWKLPETVWRKRSSIIPQS